MGCAGSTQVNESKTGKKLRVMSATERTFNAAILIQKWYRRYLAREEVRRRCSWTIFTTLEYAGEQDQTKLYNFFTDLLVHILKVKNKNRLVGAIALPSPYGPAGKSLLELEEEGEDDELQKKTNPRTIKVEPEYRGIKIRHPMNAQTVLTLIEYYKHRKTLHAKYVLSVIHEARNILKYKPNISYASTVHSKQITVCGDLHGKLEDLLTVFYKNGLPSHDNPYVFNGDFVDRGNQSMEVLMILLACLVVWPDAVFLNRGNHEDFMMNVRYGFLKEIMLKYKDKYGWKVNPSNTHAAKILRALEDLYAWLPLATIVDSKVFIVHGGVSNNTNLKDVAAIDRHKFLTVLRPPMKDGKMIQEPGEWKQIIDLLWSDPRPKAGCFHNNFRGGGCFFGPEVTKSFLERHQLKLLIRSHQCKTDGYEYAHNDQVITVFSASNYYDTGSNRGAYIKLIGDELIVHPVLYVSSKLARHATLRQRQGILEQSALRELKRHIASKRFVLMQEFNKRNKAMVSTISLNDWCEAMEAAVGLGLPWRLLCPKLAVYDPEKQLVEYSTTLEDYHTYTEGLIEDGHTLLEALYQNKEILEAVFNMIDRDGHARSKLDRHPGSISMDEFVDTCSFLGDQLGKPIPPGTIQDLAHSIDMNKDGFIDLNEFLEAFRLVNGNRPLPSEAPPEEVPDNNSDGTSAGNGSFQVVEGEAASQAPETKSIEEDLDVDDNCSLRLY
ncbi:serine/threonine-protein phosphatase with EF-hands 2-like isoform X2 [Argiope bruennichi]|uniref:serine/threonine-protein phosphatase with EF-hands 2-like isoform X2 n=1 Tax=Argiope bruennichi TaxID=94029 RepID=UPI0024946D93|nr:serine/threonine-protein phosphatase with EF-hands 2-like isoform X2 [Argiope bruennichi]